MNNPLKYDNGSIKKFLVLFNLVLFVLFTALLLLGAVYTRFSIRLYHTLIFVFMLLLGGFILAGVALQVLMAFYHIDLPVGRGFYHVIRFFMKFTTPFFLWLFGFLGFDKNIIRKFYIEINNRMVEYSMGKYNSEDIIILLPHCLQYSGCNIKITSSPENCKRCGRCCIGDVLGIGTEFNVPIFVVTGGTAARNIVVQKKPKFIISVACERDLTSGIMDVGDVPVAGIINDRPSGPCFNTVVDARKIEEMLRKMIRRAA